MSVDKSSKGSFKAWPVFMFSILCCGLIFCGVTASAENKHPLPEKQNVIMIGDRVVDVAYNLGVVPVAMSVRGSLWPMADTMKVLGEMLGCPRCIAGNKKNSLPDAIRKYGVETVIIEKSEPYCLFMRNVRPENAVPFIENDDVQIEYVDFSGGVESAIERLGDLLGKSEEARKLLEQRIKKLAKMEKTIPGQPLNKKVVVLNGVLQESTGKCFIRVEMPGGYADKFFLDPLGCTNVGNILAGEKKVSKGHVTIRSLAHMAKANPDTIIITGASAPIQAKIHEELKKEPLFSAIPAIKNMEVYSLPAYIDSSVVEYPQIFMQWAQAISDKG